MYDINVLTYTYHLNRIGHLPVGYRCCIVRQTTKPEMIQLQMRMANKLHADMEAALHSTVTVTDIITV